MTVEERLQSIAGEMRREILGMIGAGNTGHYGGSLSVVEILAVLYFHQMRYEPQNPALPGRDCLILSKGHSAPAQYAAMALAGFFPREELGTLKKLGGRLQGHPDFRRLPGLETNTGSLGQGLSMGVGMALAKRYKAEDGRIYVVLGDGELQEGQVWEAAMAAAHYRLGRLTAVVDHNKLQATGEIAARLSLGGLREKWAAFGWETMETDGHDIAALLQALAAAVQVKNRPAVIIAHTVKGKGISFLENNPACHNGLLTREEFARAVAELRPV